MRAEGYTSDDNHLSVSGSRNPFAHTRTFPTPFGQNLESDSLLPTRFWFLVLFHYGFFLAREFHYCWEDGGMKISTTDGCYTIAERVDGVQVYKYRTYYEDRALSRIKQAAKKQTAPAPLQVA